MTRETPVNRNCLLGATLLLLACGRRDGATAQATSITTRDSSGVTIVEHPPGALAAAPSFGLGKPILTLGGASVDSLHDMTFVTKALFLSGGRFLTVDGRAARMELFDSTGTRLADFGRRGEGPTDFRGLPVPRRADDGSLWLIDAPARLMRFSEDLELRIAVVLSGGERNADLLLPLHGSTVLAVVRAPIVPPFPSSTTISRNAEYLVRFDTIRTDTLTKWLGTEWYAPASNDLGASVWTWSGVEFGRTTVVDLWGNQVVVGTNDSWTLDVRDSTGALRRRIVLHEAAQPVTEAMRDSVRSSRRALIHDWKAPAETKAASMADVDNLLFAHSVAWYQEVIAASDGALWVAETVVPTDNARRYAVFDSSGRLIRRVMMPARYRLVAADGDRVLVRRRDPDGIGYLDLVRLVPTAP